MPKNGDKKTHDAANKYLYGDTSGQKTTLPTDLRTEAIKYLKSKGADEKNEQSIQYVISEWQKLNKGKK